MGAGGEDVGRLVAERLSFTYVDEEIVSHAARKGNLSPEDVADAERRKSALRRLLEEMGRSGGAETYGLAPAGSAGDMSDDVRALIREAIEEAAGRGSVVIVAHAASFALATRDDALRVFVTASPDTRAAQFEGSLRDSDAARADYLRRFYGVDHELPTHYDLVLNTDRLGPEQAADIVVRAAELF